MLKKAIPLLLFLFSFSYAFVLEKLENKIKSQSYIQAEFIQKNFTQGLDEADIYEGILKISSPNTVKIDYTSPLKQTYFLEGNKLIIYTPEENQAIITKLNQQFITLKIFKALANKQKLTSLFTILKEDKNTVILKPKNDNQIKKIKIQINPDFTISKLEIWDNEENHTVFIFKSFKYSKERKKLKLSLPANTEIIRY